MSVRSFLLKHHNHYNINELPRGSSTAAYPRSWPSTRIRGVGVGFTDSAKETNKARSVAEIYLETGGTTSSSWGFVRMFIFHAPPPQWGGLDLDSRSSGCARLGGGVGPPLVYFSHLIEAQRHAQYRGGFAFVS